MRCGNNIFGWSRVLWVLRTITLIFEVVCAELTLYHSFTTDAMVWQKQHENLNIVHFLVGLKPEYESIRLRFWVALVFHLYLRFSPAYSVIPSLLALPASTLVCLLITSHLLSLVTIVIVTKVAVVTVVVTKVGEAILEVVAGSQAVVYALIVVVEGTLLIIIGIYMASLWVLLTRFPIRMIPRLLLLYLGRLHLTLGQLLLHKRSILNSYLNSRLFYLPPLLLLPSQILLPLVYYLSLAAPRS